MGVPLGCAFLCNHLYVVISDPAKHNGKCVMVNVTTLREKSDKTCVLQPGDIPSFIYHTSVVNYGDATCPDETNLERFITNDPSVRRYPNVEGHVLSRIIEGARTSPAFPTGLRKYL
jgi:hypothetical protein